MKHTGTDDIWRLYRREWVIVHTINPHGVSAQPTKVSARKAADQWIADHLTGRVREQDITTEEVTDGFTYTWVHIKVFKDNLLGEYKTLSAAELTAHVRDLDEYTIVPRNSQADQDIRSYGVIKL